MHAGGDLQPLPSGPGGKFDVGELAPRIGCGQPDIHPSPRNDVTPPDVAHIGAGAVEIGDIEERILARPALRRLIAVATESYAHHRNPAWRLVGRATPRALRTLDAGHGEDWNRRRGHACSVTAHDGHRRNDPLTHRDAAGAGIGKLPRPERLQAVDVWDFVGRDDNTGGTGIHDGTVAAPAKRDAQPRQCPDILAGTGCVDVGEVNPLVISVVPARRTGKSRRDADQEPRDGGPQNRRHCPSRSQCQYGG
jgi:hypothetical protein